MNDSDHLQRDTKRVALANIGLAIAVANLLRMLFSTLLPVASLGGTP